MFTSLTYNMKGFDTSVDYVRSEVDVSKPDIVFLQETWHLSNACDKLSTLHKDYMYFEQSGMDSNSTIIFGRPKGGLAIMFKRSLAGYMSKLETNSHRVCAAHMKGDGTDILIVNAYMPCDNRRCNYVNPEYQNAIESIDMLTAQHPESEYMIGADWNTDIGRRNAQTLCFYEFIERNGLLLCWNHRNSKQDYAYINHDLGHCSCVDHFILSMGLYESINACTINISPLNPSDHCVVELSLGYDVYTGTKCNVQFTKGKLAWHKAKDMEIQRY